MALTEQVQLDISQAQRQINTLETQLNTLSQPIDIPVDIETQDFERISRSLGISEQEARQLATTIGRSVSESRELDDELRQVARGLGLSEREAADFARQMQRVERATDDTTQGVLRLGTRGASVFTNLRGSLVGLIGAFGAVQGARAFLDFARDAIGAASDLEESTSKAQVVFGEFFADIQQFSQTAPQALGLANAQALEFTGTFGNLFTALGLSQQAAAQLAPEIVQLGADLASFNNIDPTEALDKLRAGLVGEAEPLRALGVNLTAAATAAKAVELGLAASTTEVSEAAKVQARYALILEQTTTAQGDVARTADSIANRQRNLAGEFEGLRAAVGTALLPVFEDLLDAAQDLLPSIADLVPALGEAAEGVFELVTPILELLGPLAELVGLFGDVRQSAQFLQQQDDPFSQLFGGITQGLTQSPISFALEQLEELQFFFRSGGLRSDDLTEAIANLNQELERSPDAVTAVFRTLQSLAEQGTVTEEVLSALTGAIDLDPATLLEVRRNILETGEAAGFTADEINTLDRSLLDLARGGADPADIALRNLIGRTTEAGDQAEIATPKIFGFSGAVQTLGNLDPNLDLNLDIESEIAELESQFDRLPTAFDAVREAFRDDENEIVDDFSTFASELEAELQAQLAFFQNIDLLRSLGFEDLADRFLDLGIESAELLADGLADPSALGRAESAIDAYEATLDRGLRQATADVVSDAISSIDDLFAALALIEDISIRGSVFLSLTGPGAEFAGSVGVGSTGTSDLVGGTPVTVNQTFTSPVTPSTEAARAAQAVNSLVGGPE